MNNKQWKFCPFCGELFEGKRLDLSGEVLTDFKGINRKMFTKEYCKECKIHFQSEGIYIAVIPDEDLL